MIKNSQELKDIKRAGYIVAKIHQRAQEISKPGVSLLKINELAEKYIKKYNGKSLFLNYQGYPAYVCTSVNSDVIHGIPRDYKLKEGDFYTLDVGVSYNGMCVDAAALITVGKIDEKTKRLLKATKEALNNAIKVVKPGATLGDIGYQISATADKYGYNVSKEYVGHFIGKEMHEDPLVLNEGKKGEGFRLEEGMTFCIEPIFIDGEEDLFVDPLDKWTVRTKHGENAAHIEHTILVTKTGGEILDKL